jgi:hypothetical protein
MNKARCDSSDVEEIERLRPGPVDNSRLILHENEERSVDEGFAPACTASDWLHVLDPAMYVSNP